MISPAVRFKQQMLARQAVQIAGAEGLAPERPTDGAEATEYQLLLAALGEDLQRLSNIQSLEKKIEAKRDMIAAFDSHVDATLAAAEETGKAVQDEIVSTMMLWHIDIGAYARALDIADYVLKHGLRLPERFKRDPATVVTEEIAVAAIGHQDEQLFDLDILLRVEAMTDGLDMPDMVRAKLMKAIGQLLVKIATKREESGDETMAAAVISARRSAYAYLQRALKLDQKIGVKKDIERLEAAIRKSSPTGAGGR